MTLIIQRTFHNEELNAKLSSCCCNEGEVRLLADDVTKILKCEINILSDVNV